jgi:hypothetical protein
MSYIKSSQADFFYSPALLQLNVILLFACFCRYLIILLTYIAEERTCITGNMAHDHYPVSPLVHAAQTYSKHTSRDCYLLLCGVTVDTENTASSTVACWTAFTELLPGNALIKSIAVCKLIKLNSVALVRKRIIMELKILHNEELR